MPILKTDQLFADYCHVSKAAVCYARKKGKLNKTSDGYDTEDQMNKRYEKGDSIKALAQRGLIVDQPDKKEEKSMSALEIEKQRQDILYRKKQNRKLDREHDRDMRDLIPSKLMAIWIGYFSTGIRTNFLTIGNKIARGDMKLRARIEKEIKRAIDKTIDGAEKGLMNELPEIIKAVEEKET